MTKIWAKSSPASNATRRGPVSVPRVNDRVQRARKTSRERPQHSLWCFSQDEGWKLKRNNGVGEKELPCCGALHANALKATYRRQRKSRLWKEKSDLALPSFC